MSWMMSAEERAYTQIKSRIQDGRLLPGDRLVHRNVAKELGVSSGSVVLALRMLERDGLIVNAPGMGAYVRVWELDEIKKLYRIRAVLEGLAARISAEEANALDIEMLIEAKEAIKKAAEANDVEAHIEADVRFHKAIVAGAHSTHLDRMLECPSIMQYSMTVFALNLNMNRYLAPDASTNHNPIADAIVNRDADAAERAAREHVEGGLRNNLDWLLAAGNVLADGRQSVGVGGRRQLSRSRGEASRDQVLDGS